MYTVLQQPLSKKAIRDFLDAKPDGIRGVVALDLSNLIDNDFEGILHLILDQAYPLGISAIN